MFMDTAVKTPTIESAQPSSEPEGTTARFEIDVKQTLNLRHQTDFAWIMPEGWEPIHN
jgi:hypothetical protein